MSTNTTDVWWEAVTNGDTSAWDDVSEILSDCPFNMPEEVIGHTLSVSVECRVCDEAVNLISADGEINQLINSRFTIVPYIPPTRRGKKPSAFEEPPRDNQLADGNVYVYVRTSNSTRYTEGLLGSKAIKGGIYKFVISLEKLKNMIGIKIPGTGLWLSTPIHADTLRKQLMHRASSIYESVYKRMGEGINMPYTVIANANSSLGSIAYTWTGSEIVKSTAFGFLTGPERTVSISRSTVDKDNGFAISIEDETITEDELAKNNGIIVWGNKKQLITAFDPTALANALAARGIMVKTFGEEPPCPPEFVPVIEYNILMNKLATAEATLATEREDHRTAIKERDEIIKARDLTIRERESSNKELRAEIERYKSGIAAQERQAERRDSEQISRAKHRTENLKTLASFLTVGVTAYGIFKEPIMALYKWLLGKISKPAPESILGLF